MKETTCYIEEVRDLTIDLEAAAKEKNKKKLTEIVEQCRAILDDVEESFI